MENSLVNFSSCDGVAIIELNRPDVYNALNDELTYELQALLKKIDADNSIRVVVLTGNGKAFCAGQDLKSIIGRKDFSYKEAVRKRYNPIIKSIRNSTKPFICRLNGIAAGAGASLALACDIIVAAEEAFIVQAFINIGLVPDSGSAYFLPRLVGAAKAFELAAMGTRLSAQQACALGIINKVVPMVELDNATDEYSRYFASAPTRAIGLIKKMIGRSGQLTLEEMLEYEALCQEIAGHTADHAEGVNAFLQKRKPSFTGN